MNRFFLVWILIHLIATPFNMYFFPEIGLLTIFVLVLSSALWAEAYVVARIVSGAKEANRSQPYFLPIVFSVLVEVIVIWQYATG